MCMEPIHCYTFETFHLFCAGLIDVPACYDVVIKDIVVSAEAMGFESVVSQIGHSVANGSLPL